MIPKKIHYCWFGKGDISPMNLACIESWSKYLPEYEIVKWDENNCPQNDFVKYHLKEKNWAFVSDYVRLYALFENGGVYFDTDIEVIKPFDDLLQHNAFVAFESKGRINNAVSGSIKGHLFFKDCMEYMIGRFNEKQDYHISPVVTTSVLKSGGYDDVKVFDSTYFYPYNPYDDAKKIKIFMHFMVTDDTYAIHHWAKSWELKKPKFDTAVQLGWGAFSRKQWYLTAMYGLKGIVLSPFKDGGYRLFFCSFFRRG